MFHSVGGWGVLLPSRLCEFFADFFVRILPSFWHLVWCAICYASGASPRLGPFRPDLAFPLSVFADILPPRRSLSGLFAAFAQMRAAYSHGTQHRWLPQRHSPPARSTFTTLAVPDALPVRLCRPSNARSRGLAQSPGCYSLKS